MGMVLWGNLFISISQNKRSSENSENEQGSFWLVCVSQWLYRIILHTLLYNDSQTSSHKPRDKNCVSFFGLEKELSKFSML